MAWGQGEKKVLYESDNIQLEVEKIGLRRVTRFRSQVDQFRLSLHVKKGTAEGLVLGDDNLMLLRTVLHKLYDLVIAQYTTHKDLLMQINFGLGQLKKQWLKSGIFEPTKVENKSYCDWIVNMLESAVFSDETLTLEGMRVDVIITKMSIGQTGSNSIDQFHNVNFNYMSQFCRRIAKNISKYSCYKGKDFFKKIKYGIVDLTEINGECTNGICLEVSIAFSLLYEHKNFCIENALKNLVEQYNASPIELMLTTFSEYNIEHQNIPNNNFLKLLEKYSEIIGRKIVLVCQSKTGEMKIFYKTKLKFVEKLRQIYLLYTNETENFQGNGHVSFVFFFIYNTYKKNFCFFLRKIIHIYILFT